MALRGIAIVLVTGAVCWIALLLYKEWLNDVKAEVSRNSESLRKLRDLNMQYQLTDVDDVELVHACDSKQEYDRFDAEAYLIDAIAEDRELFSDLVSRAMSSQKLEKEYLQEAYSIELTGWDSRFKNEAELELFAELIQRPSNTPNIIVVSRYVTPVSAHTYAKQSLFSFDTIPSLIAEADMMWEQRESRQEWIRRERAKMTNSMRYDVLRRDGFRCVLCGSSAADGVKLEVDHIIPVSKGGKTEMSNLRTLCDRCNSGKSDKME